MKIALLFAMAALAGCTSAEHVRVSVTCARPPDADALSNVAFIHNDYVTIAEVEHGWIIDGTTTKVMLKSGRILYFVGIPCVINRGGD